MSQNPKRILIFTFYFTVLFDKMSSNFSSFMEKRLLPIFKDQSQVEKAPSPPQQEKSVTEKLLSSFLKQRYPLSDTGRHLKTGIEDAIRRNDAALQSELAKQVPTVENPRLDLFADLELKPGEAERFFGPELMNVQVTKGCRHKCTFCAAGAAPKVDMMPFAAILKIAEKKKDFEDRVEKEWQSWIKTVKDATGVDITNKEELYETDGGIRRSTEAYSTVSYYAEKNYTSHPLSKLLPTIGAFGGVLVDRKDISGAEITNYYDSDAFDYRDTSFLHEDGTPADFGDVFAYLASEDRPIHITTAGWPLADKVAQRAAEKIIGLCKQRPDLAKNTRVSINRYEGSARRDLDEYLAMASNSLKTLEPLHPLILLFSESDQPDAKDFVEKVAKPIKEIFKGRLPIIEPHVSSYSGHIANGGSNDDHHDVMQCMAGIHIWPDGTVAEQHKKFAYQSTSYNKNDPRSIPKGSRPTPNGVKLWNSPDRA